MKKIYNCLIIVLLLLPTLVFAAGSITVSKTSSTINVGAKDKFTVKANNATGRVDISSSDTTVATVNTKSVWLDNDSKSVTITGKKEGTAKITVKLTDVATYDGQVLSKTYTINVTVKKKTSSSTTTTTTKKPSSTTTTKKPSSTTTKKPSTTTKPSEPTEPVVEKSSNCKLSSFSVEGYNIEKTADFDYSLTVKGDVDSINIIAIAEDPKATISGGGLKNLSIGNNVFRVVVEAENGGSNIYTLFVTRQSDKFYINDLESALLSSDSVHIVIKKDDVITKAQLDKIKETKKIVYFDRYEGEDILYTWVVDGSKLSETNDFSTNIKLKADDPSSLDTKTGYASGAYVEYDRITSIPKGITSMVYVGDNYKNGDVLKAYDLGNEGMKYLEDVTVKDKYVSLNPIVNSFFMTKADLSKTASGSGQGIKELFLNNKWFKIVCGVACGEFLVILILLLTRRKRVEYVPQVQYYQQ